MIRKLTSLEGCDAFIRELNRDPEFSEPMLSTPEQLTANLYNALHKPNDHVLGVFRGDDMTGLFVFLILEDERYIEMIVGLSREAAAYGEIADWLRENYPGFQADFVFNPANVLLGELLRSLGAEFDTEQQKMVYSGPVPRLDTTGIEPLSPGRMAGYLAMHDDDCYWTGEKVAAAPERFSVYLAVENDEVVGYTDVTNCFGENEPYALEVKEAFRRRGWGRKLAAKALEMHGAGGMMLLADVDNAPAIALYESLGFVKARGQNCQTVFWIVG